MSQPKFLDYINIGEMVCQIPNCGTKITINHYRILNNSSIIYHCPNCKAYWKITIRIEMTYKDGEVQ